MAIIIWITAVQVAGLARIPGAIPRRPRTVQRVYCMVLFSRPTFCAENAVLRFMLDDLS